eukprot:TRINITY_DN5953_c1_g1_i2.p1 TRINITY_DN5953_c1_g1~~TRINITY_DN5953_c1_g1_i2.p1  ORF type:complete len:241 (+),score=95.30 TRINITY_DN5953_c1_g1_i2:109-723(+)
MPQSIADKIADAAALKQSGNEHFKAGALSKALYDYHIGWLHLKGLSGSVSMVPESARQEVSGEETQQIKDLTISIHLNMAAVHLKQEKFEKVIEDCNVLLALDSSNVKGLFRRGKARLALNNVDAAEEDLLAAKAGAPTDAGILRELKVLERKKAAAAKKLKSMYSNMFGRMEEENKKEDAAASASATSAASAASDTAQETADV